MDYPSNNKRSQGKGKFMKVLLIGLLAIGSISTFAGEIRNRKTGESIKFQKLSEAVFVDCTNAGIPNQEIKISNLDRELGVKIYQTEDLVLLPISDKLWNINDKDSFLQILLPATLVVDTAFTPFQVVIHAIKKNKEVRDMILIKKAIESDENFDLGNNRFGKVKSYFEN